MKNIFLEIARKQTPVYVYFKQEIEEKISQLKNHFKAVQPYYAIKANFNTRVLQCFLEHQFGFEVVSQGELERVLHIQANPSQIVFNGNGKTFQEVLFAASNGVQLFNFDSLDQLLLLEEVGKTLQKPILALARVKSIIDVETHPYLQTGIFTSKFGLNEEELDEVLSLHKNLKWAKIVGIHSHIGSNIKDEEPFIKSTYRVLKIAKQFPDIEILNLGGGFAPTIHFKELPRLYDELASTYKVLIEPGRFLVAEAGYIVTRVISIKKGYPHDFLVIDCGMTELIRPALYGAFHPIKPLKNQPSEKFYLVVGPICESSDVFGEYLLPKMELGDFLLIENCGAYGYTMASHYNGKPLPPEIFVDGDRWEITTPSFSLPVAP